MTASPAFTAAGYHVSAPGPIDRFLLQGPWSLVELVVVVSLMAVSTVAGAALAARGRRPQIWFGVGGGGLVVIGLVHLLPDAWQGARALGMSPWLIAVAALSSFSAAAWVGRLGCGCHLLGCNSAGSASAAALATHRILEGTAVILAGPVVAVGLVAHTFGEGLAVGALLRSRPRQLVVWLAVMCMAPAGGAWVGRAIPSLGVAEPLLFAMAAGILTEAARTSLRVAVGAQGPVKGRKQTLVPMVAAVAGASVTFVAVQAIG